MLRRLWPRRQWAQPDTYPSRDQTGRLIDGDTVRPAGRERWTDLLPARQVEPGDPGGDDHA
jgi:hypothetical protein